MLPHEKLSQEEKHLPYIHKGNHNCKDDIYRFVQYRSGLGIRVPLGNAACAHLYVFPHSEVSHAEMCKQLPRAGMERLQA